MKVAFLTSEEPPGGIYNRDSALINALRDLGTEVRVVVPARPATSGMERIYGRLMRRLGFSVSSVCGGRRLRAVARLLEDELANIQPDIVFSKSTHFTAYLNINKPRINYVDAVFKSIVNFYPSHTNLDYVSLFQGHRADSLALRRSSMTILKSFWAASDALRFYGVPKEQLSVVPPPAILPVSPTWGEVERRRRNRQGSFNLAIIGTDWDRKGGNIAVGAVEELRRIGVDAKLSCLGMRPKSTDCAPGWIDYLPYLDKGKKADFEQVKEFFFKSHVMILPTQADFSPNVIAEAAAFGVPTIGSPVGAIGELIEHGQTGFVTSHVNRLEEYVGFLQRLNSEPEVLQKLSRNSYLKYDYEFALPVIARKLLSHMESVIYSYRSGSSV